MTDPRIAELEARALRAEAALTEDREGGAIANRSVQQLVESQRRQIAELEARAEKAEAERDELRAAIFGSANYMAALKNGNFVEMAKATEAGRLGAIARAEAAEAELARLLAEQTAESRPGWYYDADDSESVSADWADLLDVAPYGFESVVDVRGAREVFQGFAAFRCLSLDEDGCADEAEKVMFASEGEARACWPDSLATLKSLCHPDDGGA